MTDRLFYVFYCPQLKFESIYGNVLSIQSLSLLGDTTKTKEQPNLTTTVLTHKHWASLVAQLVKNPSAMRKTWVRSLGLEDSLEEGMTTHFSILAQRIPMDRGAWEVGGGGAIVHIVSQRVRQNCTTKNSIALFQITTRECICSLALGNRTEHYLRVLAAICDFLIHIFIKVKSHILIENPAMSLMKPQRLIPL